MRCAGGGVCPGVWADCRALAGTGVPRSGHILLDLSERVLRTRWSLFAPLLTDFWKGRIRVSTGGKRTYSTGTGDSQRPEEAVSGLALLSLPHYPSEAGVWVLLGRVGPSLS